MNIQYSIKRKTIEMFYIQCCLIFLQLWIAGEGASVFQRRGLYEELLSLSLTVRQFSSVLCELILLRTILKTEADRENLDVRIRKSCDESADILRYLSGKVFCRNRGPTNRNLMIRRLVSE